MKRYLGKTKPKPKRQPSNYVPPPSKLWPPKAHLAPAAAPPQTAQVSLAPSAKQPTPNAKLLSAPPLAPSTAWNSVAHSYDALLGEHGSEYHRRIVFPGVLKMLELQPGHSVLDLACGQGAFCRVLGEHGAIAIGVDASDKLINLARQRGGQNVQYHVADARKLAHAAVPRLPGVQAVTCVLAIQDIDPLEDLLLSAAWALRPGGRLVIAMTHPAFRSPKATDWGWDYKRRIQYRRVDRYLLPRREKIITHPGRPDSPFTWSFHRPLELYVKAIVAAGLLIDRLEEWPSHKRSAPGPRAAAEDLARREIPLFLALRAVKVP